MKLGYSTPQDQKTLSNKEQTIELQAEGKEKLCLERTIAVPTWLCTYLSLQGFLVGLIWLIVIVWHICQRC